MREITEEQYREALELTQNLYPLVLPHGWKKQSIDPRSSFAGQMAYMRGDGLFVIFTADRLQGDGKTWLHVSMSRKSRIPSYQDMCDVKFLFIGKERQAIQIFAPEAKHINIHPYCLHLWCALEGDGLPDFGQDGTI
jgi:hypothetical protein